MFGTDYGENIEPLYSKVISAVILWSSILLYMVLVDFEASLIDIGYTGIHTHLFGVITGLVFGGGLAELEHSDVKEKIDNYRAISALSGVVVIVLLGLLTFINSSISSLVLLYVGLWYSVNTYRIQSR